MTDHNFNLNNVRTIEEAREEMSYQWARMEGLSSLSKRNRFYNMLAIYRKFPELKAWWRYNENEYQYIKKFSPVVAKKNKCGSIIGNLPKLEIPCADITDLPQDRGLYFIGMIGINPNGTKYYLVKVGATDNLAKRLRQYGSYNPMIYIDSVVQKISGSLAEAETTCHEYLAEKAYAYAQNAREWFYVNEEEYFELCETFANKETFKAIAEGEYDEKDNH